MGDKEQGGWVGDKEQGGWVGGWGIKNSVWGKGGG